MDLDELLPLLERLLGANAVADHVSRQTFLLKQLLQLVEGHRFRAQLARCCDRIVLPYESAWSMRPLSNSP
jgi:hypothetical protein